MLNRTAELVPHDNPESRQTYKRLLLCFSHLRWNFVYQRPQHLLTRAARTHEVLFFEEPVFEDTRHPKIRITHPSPSIQVLTPVLPEGTPAAEIDIALRRLVDRTLASQDHDELVLWYYTPMALSFTDHLESDVCIYDCMDELSAFKNAPPVMARMERLLMLRADTVFTGGLSIYEAKRKLHASIHPFPSSIDVSHFGKARVAGNDPEDQQRIPRPRVGYFGVIDERLDTALVGDVAAKMPDVQFVMIGPVVKIDPATLPRLPNIHWLGAKPYAELPTYMRHWDVGWMPFALNEATRFISPTKTPEFLAAGLPVVSTAVVDVVRTYGARGLVRIADRDDSVRQIRAALEEGHDELRDAADKFLATMSWDKTWEEMSTHLSKKPISQRPVTSPPRRSRNKYDWLIVGAGFAGSVLAERIARERGESVLIVDRRNHIGGNAYDWHDEAGILVHRYGPHIFHTNATQIVEYLSQFTKWRPYEHRVLSKVDGMLLPIPINLDTINKLYGLNLTSEQLEQFFQERREPLAEVKTSEDVVVSTIGRELYEKFFRGYTRKQWGVDPSQLNKSVTARVPTRTNRDDRYFTDTFQAMPLHGYTRMFERMLSHPKINVMLQADFREIRERVHYEHLIYTGPIDEYFDWKLGKLPYRSLRFEHKTLDQPLFQPVAVVNYPQTEDYTRITEYKHLTGQSSERTSISYEYPSDTGDPYYPVPRAENETLYKRYEALAAATPNVWFVGRLATYRYYNMDQVVGQALATFRRIQETMPSRATKQKPAQTEAAE
ncbi:UDP-galactopyranose mutase [Aestuariivirga sp.]|uniref:UDP-galactopyranose mutase n=1 Tax=Aestuariivirga sp. TaxID=2650926 RepID=UPI0039E4B1A4